MYELLVPKGASNSSSCDSWTYGSGKHLRSSSPVNIGLTYPFGSNFWYLLCLSGSSKIISKCNIHLLTQLYTCTNRQIHTTQFKNHYHTLCVRQTDTHTHTDPGMGRAEVQITCFCSRVTKDGFCLKHLPCSWVFYRKSQHLPCPSAVGRGEHIFIC